MIALWTALLAIQLQAPGRVVAGQELVLRAVDGSRGVPGVELRVAGPVRMRAVVSVPVTPLSDGAGMLYRGTPLLVWPPEDGARCRVVTPSGATRGVACQALTVQPYGQPLGVTGPSGELRTAELAVVPAEVEVEALQDGAPVAVLRVTVRPDEYDRQEAPGAGLRYRERRFVRHGDGPFTMQVLEVEPSHPAVNILPVRARDRMAGRETVSSMAQRYGAAAGVNGGYFIVAGPYAGTPAGVYQLDGRVLASGAGRTALLLCRERNFVEKLEMAVVNFHGRATAENGAVLAIAGLNRPRAAGELVAFLPDLGPRILTPAGGLEAVLGADFLLQELAPANAGIPAGGMVVSGAGDAADWLREHTRPGSRLQVELVLRPAAKACPADDIVGAGPRLVHRGRPAVVSEKFAHERVRHPRTAVAVTRRRTILFVTLDGRQPGSAGMTLDELAEELVSLGAVEAMNLDGGGSTTMFVNGRVRNSPSDGKERPVGDGLLIFSVPDVGDLERLVGRLAVEGQMSAAAAGALRGAIAARDRRGLRRTLQIFGSSEVSGQARRILREALEGGRW